MLGETFDLPALIAGSDTDVAATLAAVDSAEALGLIRAVSGSDGDFSFVHALTREAVIGKMASRLRIMHARAAKALERRPIGPLFRASPTTCAGMCWAITNRHCGMPGTPRGWPSTAWPTKAAKW